MNPSASLVLFPVTRDQNGVWKFLPPIGSTIGIQLDMTSAGQKIGEQIKVAVSTHFGIVSSTTNMNSIVITKKFETFSDSSEQLKNMYFLAEIEHELIPESQNWLTAAAFLRMLGPGKSRVIFMKLMQALSGSDLDDPEILELTLDEFLKLASKNRPDYQEQP